MKKKRNTAIAGLTGFLYNHSVYWIAGFFALVLLAFWTSYYGILGKRPIGGSVHFHGVTMTMWCLLLISQAFLIRNKRFGTHRLTGKLSYVLVPLIVISGLHLSHQTSGGAVGNPDLYYHLVALMFNAIVVFSIFYGLAIWYRKRPDVHARFMISTIFPLVTPVTDRIIHKYIREFVPHLPAIGGAPIAPVVGYLLVDAIVLALLIWDWRKHGKLNVFPIVLGILILYHLSALFGYRLGIWQKIADGMMALPLS